MDMHPYLRGCAYGEERGPASNPKREEKKGQHTCSQLRICESLTVQKQQQPLDDLIDYCFLVLARPAEKGKKQPLDCRQPWKLQLFLLDRWGSWTVVALASRHHVSC